MSHMLSQDLGGGLMQAAPAQPPAGGALVDLDLLLTELLMRHPPSDAAPLIDHGRCEDQPHQYLPGARLSASHWPGFLIADEVGLGKTLSAILHLRTMHARGQVGGVVVACPGGLRTKWVDELRSRADVEAIDCGSGKQFLQLMGRIDAGEPLVVVASHGVLRQAPLLATLSERGLPSLLLTVIDEAHHVRNPSTRLHDAAQLLAMASQQLLLLTATPVNLDEEELWVQLSLCAPDRWPHVGAFRTLLRPLRQLNEALDGISREPPALDRLRQCVHQLRHTPGFDGDPRLEELWRLALDDEPWEGAEAERLDAQQVVEHAGPWRSAQAPSTRVSLGVGGEHQVRLPRPETIDTPDEPDAPPSDATAARRVTPPPPTSADDLLPLSRREATRQHVADLLRQLRPLNPLIARTRRADLDMEVASRRAITLDVTLSEPERRLYLEARKWSQTLWRLRHPEGVHLDWTLLIPERMASSCLPAFAQHTIRQMKQHANAALAIDRDGQGVDEGAEGDGAGISDVEWRVLRRIGDLEGLLDAAESLGDRDAKWDALWSWLGPSLERDTDGGVLVFSQFLGTLDHLAARLQEKGATVGVLTGKVAWADRELLYEAHRNGEIEVLLSSEVGGEGLDLQHCHRIVNYDLPWNPMRIEQRIGRVDRFGQEAPVIDVLNLAVEGTIDAAILGRLYDRIRLFEDTLGMLDPLLGQAMRAVALEAFWGARRKDEVAKENAVDGLLAQRKKWLAERATSERAALGPDPGIGAVRRRTLEHGLAVESEVWVRWLRDVLQRADAGARLDAKGDALDGLWQLRLSDRMVNDLAARAHDAATLDAIQVGWRDVLKELADGPGPHWLDVVVEREGARAHPHAVYLAPWHPLVRWAVETAAPLVDAEAGAVAEARRADLAPWAERFWARPAGRVVVESARPPAWPERARWLICVDWAVEGLAAHHVRRWLALDDGGMPLEDQPTAPMRTLGEVRETGLTEAEQALLAGVEAGLAEALRADELALLRPQLAELQHNAESAWQGRIRRERLQLAQAQERARTTGEPTDPRWIRMKQGLIRRLEAELTQRLAELEAVAEHVAMRLAPRVVVRLV